MRKINLPNRDGFRFYLEEVADKEFLLKCKGDYFPPISISRDEVTSEIIFIDPAGGYPMGVGGNIAGMIIDSITESENGFLFKFE